MKKLFRIVLLVIVLLLVFYLTGERVKENETLEAPVKHGTAVPVETKGVGSVVPQTQRPEKGLSTFVGKKASIVEQQYGEPNRIEPSRYAYDWWVYDDEEQLYFGVTEKGMVNQVYTLDTDSNIEPFEIGQNLNDIYRFAIMGPEIDVMVNENQYTLSLNSEDMQTRPVIIYQDLFAQLYVDQETEVLEGVRFIDPTTLVLHQPYEMTYMGELLMSQPPSSTRQIEVNEATERQLFELVNRIRTKHELESFHKNYRLNQVAKEQSEKLALEKVTQAEDDKKAQLIERLKDAEIEQKKAGENTAFNYADAIEAVHGWMNSADHRQLLLDKDFTDIGTGVYGDYFTQIMIKSTEEQKSIQYE